MKSILLVEDNDDDAELAELAFAQAECRHRLTRVRDGEEALDFLLGHGAEDRPLPAVVLLDLNLPKLNGLQVLHALRAAVRTRHLPIVMLTSSNDPKDRARAYENRVNSYICKPTSFEPFVEATKLLILYWLTLNQLPEIEISGAGPGS